MAENEQAGEVVPIREAPLPTEIDEVDALRLEKVSLERDLVVAQMRLLEEQMRGLQERMKELTARGNALGTVLREKYKVVDGDRVDVAGRRVERKK